MGSDPEVQYPDVTVQLTGTDGNAFAVVGSVAREIRKAHGQDAAKAYEQEAMGCNSYDALLRHVMRTVNVQ